MENIDKAVIEPMYKNLSKVDIVGEVWMPVIGYEDRYSVSNFGRIKGIERYGRREYLMKQNKYKSKGENDYLRVVLYNGTKKQFAVHRILAISFWGRHKGKVVNHKNGVKWDNRIDNLEFISHSENRKHAHRTGLHPGKRGDSHHFSVFSESVIINIKKEILLGNLRNCEISRKYKVSQQLVCDIKKGRRRAYLWT